MTELKAYWSPTIFENDMTKATYKHIVCDTYMLGNNTTYSGKRFIANLRIPYERTFKYKITDNTYVHYYRYNRDDYVVFIYNKTQNKVAVIEIIKDNNSNNMNVFFILTKTELFVYKHIKHLEQHTHTSEWYGINNITFDFNPDQYCVIVPNRVCRKNTNHRMRLSCEIINRKFACYVYMYNKIKPRLFIVSYCNNITDTVKPYNDFKQIRKSYYNRIFVSHRMSINNTTDILRNSIEDAIFAVYYNQFEYKKYTSLMNVNLTFI